MLKTNKILLLSLLLILFSSFVSAIVENDVDTIGFYGYNEGSLLDLTPNNNDLTNTGATNTSSGILGNAYDFELADPDHMSVASTDFTFANHDMSVVFWMKPESLHTAGQIDMLLSYGDDTSLANGGWFSYVSTGGFVEFGNYNGGFATQLITNVTINTATWYHVVLTFTDSTTTAQAYINGEDAGSQNWGQDITTPSGTPLLYIGKERHPTTHNHFDGIFDEINLWNKTLVQSEAQELYRSGVPTSAQQWPFTPTNVTVNESTESLVVGRQIGSITLSTSFQVIENITFEVPVNDTPAYFSHVIEAEKVGGSDSAIQCEATIDGINVLSINRTIDSSTFGNMYLVTENQTLDVGNHTEVVRCKRSNFGGGSISLSKGVCIGHGMFDENNQILNNQFFMFNFSGLPSNFTLMDEFNFTTSNFTTGTSVIGSIIVDWNSQYDFTSTGNITTMIQVNGFNCSEFQIGGVSGDSRIAGGICGQENVTPNTDINIKIFGKDSGGVAFMNMFVKEILLEDEELLFGEGVLVGTNITSSSLTFIGAFPISNNDHANVDLSGQLGLAVKSNSGTTTFSLQARINGSVDFNTSIYQRTLDENGGAIMLQDVIENAPIGQAFINVYVACANSDCTITGSNGVAYITNVVTEIQNAFNVSVIDNFDNSSISEFNVTVSSGAILSTTVGSLLVFSNQPTDNLSIKSDFNGGYFNVSIFNHNTTNDLIQTMNQTLIGWDCVEKVSGNDLNCTSPTESEIFNYNVIGNPHTQSINVSGYLENLETFNVTALQSQTLNATMFTTNLTLESISSLGVPTTCTYNITSLNHTFTESVTGSPNSSVGLINGSYSVLADCTNFAFLTQNVTIENVTQTLIFNLFTENSINITFIDSETNIKLNGTNITVTFIGATAQTNNTITGDLYVDLLNPSEYTILSEADTYRQSSYILTLDDRENIQLTIYMEKVNQTELVLISVIEKYSKDPVPNAVVTIQKYRDNAWTTDQIVSTDFQGFTEAHFILSSQNTLAFYNFLVEVDGTVFFGVINSNQNKKSIYAEDVTNGIGIEIDTSPSNTVPTYQTVYDIVTSIKYTNTTNTSGFFIFTFDDTNNLPRSAILNVTQAGEINCTNSVTSESASMNCAVSVPLGEVKLFTGSGSILIGNEWVIVESLTLWIGIDETTTFDWRSTGIGYSLAFFVVLIAFILFAKIPSMSIISGTIAFAGLVIFRVLFHGLNIGLLVTILFAAYLLSRIPSKSGVNA